MLQNLNQNNVPPTPQAPPPQKQLGDDTITKRVAAHEIATELVKTKNFAIISCVLLFLSFAAAKFGTAGYLMIAGGFGYTVWFLHKVNGRLNYFTTTYQLQLGK